MSRIPERVRTARLLGELGGPRSAEQTAALVARDAAAWERDGWGPWIVRDRVTGCVLGRAGLARTEIEGRPRVELAWLLTARRWGEGLASEIGREALRAAFEDVGIEEVVAVTLPGNNASRGVMRKLGMAEEGVVQHAGRPHVLARLTRGARPPGRTPPRPARS